MRGGMHTKSGTLSELATLAQRANQVWPFVAIEDRLTLGAATLLMGITSAANTGWLYYLVNSSIESKLGLIKTTHPERCTGTPVTFSEAWH